MSYRFKKEEVQMIREYLKFRHPLYSDKWGVWDCISELTHLLSEEVEVLNNESKQCVQEDSRSHERC